MTTIGNNEFVVKPQEKETARTSSKITELTEPVRGWLYHSGATQYTERLRDGRLIYGYGRSLLRDR